MLLLPKTIGPITLIRKLGTGGVAESYYGTLHGPRGREVVVRRVLPYILNEPARLDALELRVRDLLGLDHPHLVRTVEWIVHKDDRYIVEECVNGIDLARLLQWCRANETPLPPNVFLNLATQICNGLEALHGSQCRGSHQPNLLHLGLKPSSIFVDASGQVLLGGYGLCPSPTLLPQGSRGGSAVPFRMEYLSPEQAEGAPQLTPPSDIFALGSILYELLTLTPLFRGGTGLETLQRIRRAEITSQLLKIREAMPGLDRVLYRALTLKPQHRYQRAFVMREDLRALMSGYSFHSIAGDTQEYLSPLFRGSGTAVAAIHEETTGSIEVQSTGDLVAQSKLESEDHTVGRIEDARDSSVVAPPPRVRVPDAPDGQDSFDEDIETKIKEPPEAAEAPEALLGAQPLRWDPDPIATDDRPDEVSDSLETEMTGELTSEVSLPEPSPEPPPALPQPSPLPAPEVEDELPHRVMRNLVHKAPQPSGQSVGPRTVAQVGEREVPPSALEQHQEQHREQHREANTALRNIRAAAQSEAESSEPPIEDWKRRRKLNITAISALAGMALIFACAGGVFWSLGWILGEDPETDQSRNEAREDGELASSQSGMAESSASQASTSSSPESNTGTVQDPRTPNGDTEAAEAKEDAAEALKEDEREEKRVASRAEPSSEPSSREEDRTERSETRNRAKEERVYEAKESSLDEYGVSQEAIVSSVLDSPDGFETGSQVDLDWDYYARQSERGTLSPSDQLALESVQIEDESAFSRSRALLLMNAHKERDPRATKLYLEQLFLVPENRYNPVYLTAEAQLLVNQQRFEAALHSAKKAELRWQDIPSPLIIEKMAEIYEVKARSHQGLFYQSEDLDDLDEALRAWKKYRDHVARHSRKELLAKADLEMSKLQDARSRME